jgi:hypothetical protein
VSACVRACPCVCAVVSVCPVVSLCVRLCPCLSGCVRVCPVVSVLLWIASHRDLSLYRTDGEMVGGINGKDVEGNGCGAIETLFCYLHAVTDGSHTEGSR